MLLWSLEYIKVSIKEYIRTIEILYIEGRPNVRGSAYHTHGISILIYKIMKPNLKEISHILKDNFNFVARTKKYLKMGKVLRVADIKILYSNISQNLIENHDWIGWKTD